MNILTIWAEKVLSGPHNCLRIKHGLRLRLELGSGAGMGTVLTKMRDK